MEDNSRRTFLKIAGATLLGGVSAPIVTRMARGEAPVAAPTTSQLAMVINLRQCLRQEGCVDCVTACHQAHNVPLLSDPAFNLSPEEIRMREIKWIWKETFKSAFPTIESPFLREDLEKIHLEKKVLVLCNHCENPPCVRVCPTKATYKRASDGIVMMDMHRCIGCRYCVVACPYGSRSFNWRDPRLYLKEEKINPNYPTRSKGVVEKCNFCDERLANGLQPACVTACKYRAISFGDLSDPSSDVRRLLKTQYTIRRKPGLGTNPQIYYVV